MQAKIKIKIASTTAMLTSRNQEEVNLKYR
jgi:hypothetical protein